MPRYVAFLRAVNVGGRTVKMDVLRGLFEALGLKDVETFIASGNVIFSSASRSESRLCRQIESVLLDSLGYEVSTFVRTDAEVAAIAAYRAFPEAQVKRARAFNVALLAEPLDREGARRLTDLKSPIDALHAHGREIYWLCRKKQSKSKLTNNALERALKTRTTVRGLDTIRRISTVYPPARGRARG